MKSFKIGVLSNSFRLGTKEGIRKAAELGTDGVQVGAGHGEMSPEQMDASARTTFREFCSGLGLEISALCGDLGGHGLQIEEENKIKISLFKGIIDLAADVGTAVVTTHIGVIPNEKKSAVYQTMLAACKELGEHADSHGVTFAIETGPETAEVLKDFLVDVGSKGVGVNLDPANLVMVTGVDPVLAVRTLGDRIVHTHAKDGVQLQSCDPVEVYGAFASGGFGELEKRMGKLFKEVPLGQGDVDWDNYLKALEEIGYDGFLTIEREVGEDPAKDIAEAIKFLRKKIE